MFFHPCLKKIYYKYWKSKYTKRNITRKRYYFCIGQKNPIKCANILCGLGIHLCKLALKNRARQPCFNANWKYSTLYIRNRYDYMPKFWIYKTLISLRFTLGLRATAEPCKKIFAFVFCIYFILCCIWIHYILYKYWRLRT